MAERDVSIEDDVAVGSVGGSGTAMDSLDEEMLL